VLILYPECAQTHLCASVISKTFPGVLPSDPLFSRNETGRDKTFEIKELNDYEEERTGRVRKLADIGQMEDGLKRRDRHASSEGTEGRCAPGGQVA
jgi:hypothetical protein